ncbi:hypothetical protein BN133_492 [Cronobacter dublinensis 582]|nr:hypothetical protein BN133_492 [Cronobacter dublinensis 582]
MPVQEIHNRGDVAFIPDEFQIPFLTAGVDAVTRRLGIPVAELRAADTVSDLAAGINARAPGKSFGCHVSPIKKPAVAGK